MPENESNFPLWALNPTLFPTPSDFFHIYTFVRSKTFIAVAVVVNGQLYGIVISNNCFMFSGCRNKIKGFPPTKGQRKTKTNKTNKMGITPI